MLVNWKAVALNPKTVINMSGYNSSKESMAEVKPRNPVPRKHHHSSRKAEFSSQTGRNSCAHRVQGVSNWLDSKGKKRALLGHGSLIQRREVSSRAR